MSITYNDGPNLYPSADAPLTVDRPAPPPDIPASRIPFSHAPTVDGSASAIGQAQEALEKVTAQFEKYIGAIDPTPYSPDGLRKEIARFSETDAGRAIDAAVSLANNRYTAAESNVDAVLAALSPDGDTAAELRATRYWDRTRRILDNTRDDALPGKADELITAARGPELGTLLQELVPYIQSRKIAGEVSVMASLYAKSPEYRTAREQLKRAGQARSIIEQNANLLRDRIRNTHAPAGYRRPFAVDARGYDPDNR
ncbi:hypothetical protein C5E51_29805 [Nocardia nova]|uniref:hypothetical protein n=1 Tax=Nocardia nova TaxID=37330 RepID=UPI000CE9CA80|nr:hypothetical protein [Nocardia nova]PPJ02589.1 hypothetical protein C5E51_29805 [Nocardia nova]